MNYASNMNRVLAKLKANLVSFEAMEKITKEVATGVRASNLRRIHNDGKAANGSNIGSYSTKPMYVSLKASPRKFTPKGKTGKTKFSNGKSHKSGYFRDGYKGFRGTVGRETAYVNLQLTGSLKADFNMEKTLNGWSIGFGKKSKIADALETKYGKLIWGVSQQDREIINTIIRNFISRVK